jgi:hypothetical protein
MGLGTWVEPQPPIARRVVVRIKCVVCGQHERRMHPAPYGQDHVYGGICTPCLKMTPRR